MVQILPQEQSFGDLLGAGVGSGVSTGLQGLLKQFTEERQFNKLLGTLGMGTTDNSKSQTNIQNQTNQGTAQVDSQTPTEFKPPYNQQKAIALSVHPNENIQRAGKAMLEQNKAAFDQYKFEHKLESQQNIANKKLAFQETKDTREAVDNAYKNTLETNTILKKMDKLNEGKLISPATDALFEKMGVPISLLGDPNSEEFQKLSQNLMKGVTQFGNRILQVEFSNFMKQIPTLKNSAKGRKLIIKNMLLLNDMNIAAYNAKKDILKENKQIPPLDLFDQIQERIQPEYDRIQDEMINPPKEQKTFKFQKVNPGTKITEDIVDQLLQKYNNDPKKAENAAKQLGYSF